MDTPSTSDIVSLKSVDPIFGRELSRVHDTNNVNLTTILATIHDTDDLVLRRPLDFRFLVSTDYNAVNHIQSVNILLLNDVFNNEVIRHHCSGFVIDATIAISGQPGNSYTYLLFPFLDYNNKNYSLAVWFFAFRQLFKLPSLPPWSPPITVVREIKSSFDTYALSGSSSVLVHLQWGVGRTRGRRPYMEDVDIAFDTVRVHGDRSIAVYGVLDGHGGAECAAYASEELPAKIAKHLRDGHDIQESIYKSFIETDSSFLKTGKDPSGSTANVVVYDPQRQVMLVANTGDTRSVLCRNGIAVDISKDKKATDAEEIARIAREGGFVSRGRVLGSLAVSRAFGDRELKHSKISQRILIVDPEITIVEILPHVDEFVILATDGLWDVMSSTDAVAMAKAAIDDLVSTVGSVNAITQADLSKIADHMANHAVRTLNSMDNVTVMIVRLIPTTTVFTRMPATNAASFKPLGAAVSSAGATSATVVEKGSSDYNDNDGLFGAEGDLETLTHSHAPAINNKNAPAFSSLSINANSNISNKKTPAGSARTLDEDMLEFLMDDSNF